MRILTFVLSVVVATLLVALSALIVVFIVVADESSLWRPVSREEIRRKLTKVAETFLVTLVVGLVAFLLLFGGRGGNQATLAIWYALALAFIAAAVAGMLVSLSFNRAPREITGLDLGRVRRIGTAVFGRRAQDLSDSELTAAARYASTVSLVFAFQASWLALLLAGIGLQRVLSLIDGDTSALNIAIIVGYVVLLAALIPLTLVRIRRSRRDAASHAEWLTAG